MKRYLHLRNVLPAILFVGLLATSASAQTSVLEEAQKSFAAGDYDTVIALLNEEIERNPGHEEAYVLLAQTYERREDKEKAIETWEKLQRITESDDRRQEARLGLLRTRGPDVPDYDPGESWDKDPYKVDIGKFDWEKLASEVNGLEVKYIGQNPPALVESPYFAVLAATSHAADACNYLCEKYTEFLLSKYFIRGQEWALRVPIIIYKNHDDYVKVGGFPAQSAGVTSSDPRTGVPSFIALYMLNKEGELDRESLEGTLPHELTHMVLHEFFGGTEVPRWVDEGMARRMEQSRNHYEEAAKTGRDAVAGEYYSFRELFAQKNYPQGGDRTWRFYEQSATIVLFLLEAGGPDAAATFLKALQQHKSHDEAAAGALGIPVEGAVEEFERRWAEWATNIYVRFGDKLDDGDIIESKPLDEEFPEPFNMPLTVNGVEKWYSVATDSMDRFKDVGGSTRYWKIEEGRLVSTFQGGAIGSLIGIRTDEEPPMVLRCKVRWTGDASAETGRLGVAMLDHRADDTGIQVLVQLRDKQPHRLTCMVTDELAVYLDDVCAGRFPALRAADINEDIDWPLAFVAYSPIEIYEIEAGTIEKFKVLEVTTTTTPEKEKKEKKK